ncbi:MAG: RhbF-like rhizobactin siderophore biosynthesis protein [Actinobacteria bacterium]|nr:MAG: RhbF-like rhizobactin siderophore biosynthesis protein [Actinomycetota bacterium]
MTITTDAALAARAELDLLAPQLGAGYTAALPVAVDVVGRRLLGAAWRERLGSARDLLAGRALRHYGFDRVELAQPVATHPAGLLDALGVRAPGLAAELADAVTNLAVAYARRPAWDPGMWTEPDPDVAVLRFERLATEGHHLHPCGRTRLGWRVADLLAHDQESPATAVGFIAVRRDLDVGDDVGGLLRRGYPWLPAAPPGYRLQPVHAWQLDTVVPERYGDLLATGALRVVPQARLCAAPTTALRTVLLEPDATGTRRYLKLSLGIQVTSTRRSISVASTRNGPAVTALLDRLLAGESRVLTLPEVAGAAVVTPDGRSRDLSAIVRGSLAGRLEPGETALPAAALTARAGTGTVLDELLHRHPDGPLQFLADYADLLLPPLLRLARAGVGLEAHLQNSLPTFRGGVPHRIAFRDFAGLRLHLPRLAAGPARWPGDALWPGSVVGTVDVDVMRAKLGYTAVQAHLGELVRHLVDRHGVELRAAWHEVRRVLDRSAADPADHAFLTAPRVPHKALVRMRLAGDGDLYVPVHNPLHAS